MAIAPSIIPVSILSNLAENLYETRKNAALEIEQIVHQLAEAGDHDGVTSVVSLLITEFMNSPEENHRKGGVIGLATVTVGLTTEAAQHLEVVRGKAEFMVFFSQISDVLCKLSEDPDENVQKAAHILDRLVKEIAESAADGGDVVVN